MSRLIYTIIEYKKGCSLDVISDKCFQFISIACKKKIAINRVDMIDSTISYLKNNEMGMNISNSYIFCCAEDFVEADFSLPNPLEGAKLKDLEELLSNILNDPIVNRIRLYIMTSEVQNEADFKKITCNIDDFTRLYKEMLFSSGTYAYEFIFNKKD